MFKKSYLKGLLYSTTVALFIGCAGAGGEASQESAQEQVLQHIQEYVADTNASVSLPQKEDYEILGFNDLSEDEVAYLNQGIQGLEPSQVDSVEELKELIRISRIEPPVAYNETLSYVASETGSLTIPLDVEEGEANQTLTYTIKTQPKHGTVTIKGNVITYIPNGELEGYDFHDGEELYDEVEDYPSAQEYYDDRYDNDIDDVIAEANSSLERSLVDKRTTENYNPSENLAKLEQNTENITYEVSNGTKTSEANVQIIARETAIPSVEYNHIIWFNGTSEEIETTKPLFKGVDADHHTIMKGWGLENFRDNRGSALEGIIYTRSSGIIDSYINSRLEGEREAIYQAPNLVVGGFSRGGCFLCALLFKEVR